MCDYAPTSNTIPTTGNNMWIKNETTRSLKQQQIIRDLENDGAVLNFGTPSDGFTIRITYSNLDIINDEMNVAIRIMDEGGNRPGVITMSTEDLKEFADAMYSIIQISDSKLKEYKESK